MKTNQPAEAIKNIEYAQDILEKIYARNKSAVRIRTQLADVLLTRAAIETAIKMPSSAAESCRFAIEVLGSEANISTDFRILDPWVRAHICLGWLVCFHLKICNFLQCQ